MYAYQEGETVTNHVAPPLSNNMTLHYSGPVLVSAAYTHAHAHTHKHTHACARARAFCCALSDCLSPRVCPLACPPVTLSL